MDNKCQNWRKVANLDLSDLDFDFIECFTTTFLPLFNWVDEDDDEDEVGLKEKPEDTRLHQKDYIDIRTEAPGMWTKDLINLIPIYCHYWDCGLRKVQVCRHGRGQKGKYDDNTM